MKIVYTESFSNRLIEQIRYISKDNPAAAERLKRDLIKKIKKIKESPLIYRKSIYFDDASVRELVFKGYIVVFRINHSLEQIEVFGFVKFRSHP